MAREVRGSSACRVDLFVLRHLPYFEEHPKGKQNPQQMVFDIVQFPYTKKRPDGLPVLLPMHDLISTKPSPTPSSKLHHTAE